MILHHAPIIIGITLTVFNCFDFTTSSSCTPGQARLVNGTSKWEGVLEVCEENSTWSTVCSRYMSCNNLKVACRQAGFDNVTQSSRNYTAWWINKPKVGFYSCTGSEDSLFNCTKQGDYDGSSYYSCGYGVVTLTCSTMPEDSSCETQNDVRLFGGSNKGEGQLQVCRNGRWNDVCDYNGWHDSQALGHIACRQLGYSGDHWISTTYNAHFYQSNSSLASSSLRYSHIGLRCYDRNANSMSNCYFYAGSNCGHSCYKSEVAIKCVPDKTNCKDNKVRLVGGRNDLEGWVEVCVNGVWGRVNRNVEGNTKDIICSTLGYNDTGARIISSSTARYYKFKTINSPPLIKYINCCDRDKTFSTCDKRYIKKTERVSHDDLAIGCVDGCTTGRMRLVGGDTKHEGVVEVCVGGVWRAVGLSEWDEIDANVVCQSLYPGQRYAYAMPTNSSVFTTTSNRDTYYDQLECNGAETSIYNCRKRSGTFSGLTAAVRCQPVCDCSTITGG